MGKLKDYKVRLNIDESIEPVASKPRRIPFHIWKKVDSLIADDIIEKIPDTQPTPWVSRIVVVGQKNDNVRLCIDMRKPNLAIKRTRYPIPTVSEIDVLLNGSAYFSKLDVRQAFHQLELHEESRYLITFCTHRGLFRYKIGLMLKEAKCEFLQREILFFGHIYSKEGIRPDPSRINDIINLEPPSTIRDIHSFLGMLNYCSKFIHDFSTLTHPLREVIKQNKFTWDEIRIRAFETLKQKLTSTPVMSYFDLGKETKLVVDASPFGISGILMQKDDYKIVAYRSMSLTEVEKHYSQTEREGLAIVWAVEHFHQYLYGGTFTIITDHKPFEYIYGQSNSKLSARIERWVLRLQPYKSNVEFRNGEDNLADYMSRHPSTRITRTQENYNEQHNNFIVKHSVPKAVTRKEIIDGTLSLTYVQID